jgi:hypothetical protein
LAGQSSPGPGGGLGCLQDRRFGPNITHFSVKIAVARTKRRSGVRFVRQTPINAGAIGRNAHTTLIMATGCAARSGAVPLEQGTVLLGAARSRLSTRDVLGVWCRRQVTLSSGEIAMGAILVVSSSALTATGVLLAVSARREATTGAVMAVSGAWAVGSPRGVVRQDLVEAVEDELDVDEPDDDEADEAVEDEFDVVAGLASLVGAGESFAGAESPDFWAGAVPPEPSLAPARESVR